MTRIVRILLPIFILAVGFGAFSLLASMREPPQRAERVYLGPLVEVIAAPPQKVQVIVEGQGTVRPDAQVNIVPQVSGVVVWKAAEFEPGGSFAKGDLLFEVDPRDYQLSAAQARPVLPDRRLWLRGRLLQGETVQRDRSAAHANRTVRRNKCRLPPLGFGG